MKRVALLVLAFSIFISHLHAVSGKNGEASTEEMSFSVVQQKITQDLLPSVDWQLKDFSGIQTIRLSTTNLSLAEGQLAKQQDEKIAPHILYSKRFFFTTNVFDTLKVDSFINASYKKDSKPMQLTLMDMPYMIDSWPLFSASISISHKFEFKNFLALSPFVAYNYMRYDDFEPGVTSEIINRHYILGGATLELQVTNIMLLSLNAFFAPSFSFLVNKNFNAYTGGQLTALLAFYGISIEAFYSLKVDVLANKQNIFKTIFNEIGASIKFDL